jgi:hypothetical protein
LLLRIETRIAECGSIVSQCGIFSTIVDVASALVMPIAGLQLALGHWIVGASLGVASMALSFAERSLCIREHIELSKRARGRFVILRTQALVAINMAQQGLSTEHKRKPIEFQCCAIESEYFAIFANSRHYDKASRISQAKIRQDHLCP